MPLTRFGFHFSSTSYGDVSEKAIATRVLDVARAAEQSGFDSLWVPDHVHQGPVGGGPGGAMFEAYTLLGAIAAVTSTVKLGSLVSPVTFRNPAILAKTVTSLDVISEGRAVLGLGAAWDTDEHRAYRIEFPPVKEREDRLEEAVVLCRQMLSEEPASYEGRYYTIENAWNEPRPVQERLPILIGGGGEKRTLAIAAQYADACNVFGQPTDVARKFEVLKAHCERLGRNPADVARTCSMFPPATAEEVCDAVSERLAVGAEGVVLFGRDAPSPTTVESWGKSLSRAFG